MRKLLLAALLSTVAFPAFAWDVSDMNAQIDQTNVLMNDNCSGTIVDRAAGMVLTANHCVQDTVKTITKEEVDKDGKVKEVKIQIKAPGTISQIIFDGADELQRNTYTYNIIARDIVNDVALVKAKAKLPGTREAKLLCGELRRGDTVYAVGNPFVVLYATVTKGIVASVNRTYRTLSIDDNFGEPTGDAPLVQHTAPIEGGNSGGALYNDAGELVGVNVRGSRINETLALSVPPGPIKKFFKDNGIKTECGIEKVQ